MVQKINEIAQSTFQNTPVRGRVLSSNELSFQTLLSEQLKKEEAPLQFSKHAAERVAQRGIEVTPDLLSNLNEAVEKARSKGAKEVVIIDEKGAFIVNVPNKVVVTTMAQKEMKNNIFTNIDSAVII